MNWRIFYDNHRDLISKIILRVATDGPPPSSGSHTGLDWRNSTQWRPATPRRCGRLQRGVAKVGLEAVNGYPVVAATHVQSEELRWPLENKIGAAVKRRKWLRWNPTAHVHKSRRWELARDFTSRLSICEPTKWLGTLRHRKGRLHRRRGGVSCRRQLAGQDEGGAEGQLCRRDAAVASWCSWCSAHAQKHPGEVREPITGGGAGFQSLLEAAVGPLTPRSDVKLVGTPNLQIQPPTKASAQGVAVVDTKGKASNYHIVLSITVRMWVWPSEEGGKRANEVNMNVGKVLGGDWDWDRRCSGLDGDFGSRTDLTVPTPGWNIGSEFGPHPTGTDQPSGSPDTGVGDWVDGVEGGPAVAERYKGS